MVYGLLFKIFEKSDDFNFLIVNFPFICNNIPAAPAYGVYISQLVRYYRDRGTYQDFLERGLVLTRKLLNQGFLLVQSHVERLTVATMTCFTAMEYMCHNGRRICSTCEKHFPVLSSFSSICMFCRSLFLLLYLFFAIVLSVLLRYKDILIIPLVSSNSSYIELRNLFRLNYQNIV